MGEFVKKTMMGYYKEVSSGGLNSEYTHVILTKKEYGEILKEKAQAEQSSRDIKQEASRKIREAKDQAKQKIQQAEAEAHQRVLIAERELDEAKKEADYQKSLNKNLLRISRERANADRKLKPKKEHTGYLVVSSIEKDHRFRANRNQLRQVRLWETSLQSPYSINFTESQARKQIWEDLFSEEEDRLWLIGGIGIASVYNGRYEELIKRKEWDIEHKEENILLKREMKLRANFRAGYWEISFLHTKALDVVPEEMRVR